MNPGSEETIRIDKLVDACMHNDSKAQVELYEFFARTLYNTSLRIVQDTMLAEDIVQESFMKAFASLAQFRKEVPFVIWLRRIVINKSLDALRKRKVEFLPIEENMAIDDSETENDRTIAEMNTSTVLKIKQAVNNLTDGYRIIFSLFYFEGYDHDEIAQIMNISPSTSRSQLTRARQKVISQMKNQAL